MPSNQRIDFATTIHHLQRLNNKRQQRGGVTKWKHRIHRTRQLTHKDKGRKKESIKGVSTYFNPGELVAIMGPSSDNQIKDLTCYGS